MLSFYDFLGLVFGHPKLLERSRKLGRLHDEPLVRWAAMEETFNISEWKSHILIKYHIYTIILLKSVGVRKLQVAILARSSREMSLTVRIVWQYILSRVCVSVRPSFFIREKHNKLSWRRVSRKFLLNKRGVTSDSLVIDRPCPARTRAVNVVVAATDWANTAKTTSQSGDSESLYLHGLKNVVYESLRSHCVCIMCVKINNDELFCDAFPFENSYDFISG